MDDKTQQERLEQELRFLKESFDAEVISKEEFEKGKERVERKIKELGVHASGLNNKEKNEPTDKLVESSPDEEKYEENIQAKTIQEKNETEIQSESVQEKIEDQSVKDKQIVQETRKENKLFKYAIVFLVLALLIFFSFSLLKTNKESEKQQNEIIATCNTDIDCKQNGKEGICVNPGTRDAKCQFQEVKTRVIVLNDRKECFNCDAQRVLRILESWFGPLSVEEFNYDTNESKELLQKFDVNLLPFYILDESIINKTSFKQFSKAFIKKDSSYVLSEDASAPTFYFRREYIPKKLDFFVISSDGASVKAENNLKEFLDNFPNIKFEKYLSTDEISKELGIKVYPTFLINNRIKFSGVHTAETIKNNFCKLNHLEDCQKALSKNLI